jgi:hypothetical protein
VLNLHNNNPIIERRGNFSRAHPPMPCRRLEMRLKPLSIRIFAATVPRLPVAQ